MVLIFGFDTQAYFGAWYSGLYHWRMGRFDFCIVLEDSIFITSHYVFQKFEFFPQSCWKVGTDLFSPNFFYKENPVPIKHLL